jgi:hypothetical protein
MSDAGFAKVRRGRQRRVLPQLDVQWNSIDEPGLLPFQDLWCEVSRVPYEGNMLLPLVNDAPLRTEVTRKPIVFCSSRTSLGEIIETRDRRSFHWKPAPVWAHEKNKAFGSFVRDLFGPLASATNERIGTLRQIASQNDRRADDPFVNQDFQRLLSSLTDTEITFLFYLNQTYCQDADVLPPVHKVMLFSKYEVCDTCTFALALRLILGQKVTVTAYCVKYWRGAAIWYASHQQSFKQLIAA